MQKVDCTSIDREPKETINLLSDSDDDDKSTDDTQQSIEVSVEVSDVDSDDDQDEHFNVTAVEQNVSIWDYHLVLYVVKQSLLIYLSIRSLHNLIWHCLKLKLITCYVLGFATSSW